MIIGDFEKVRLSHGYGIEITVFQIVENQSYLLLSGDEMARLYTDPTLDLLPRTEMRSITLWKKVR